MEVESQSTRTSEQYEYLFNDYKAHDCYVTVGDPNAIPHQNIETIGFCRAILESHSYVFQRLLESRESVASVIGQHCVRIPQLSPEFFRYFLMYAYGGLIPTVDRPTTADLLYSADVFQMTTLVDNLSVMLIPRTIEELFPALSCVARISLPLLMPFVTRMVQQQTDKVVESPWFIKNVCNYSLLFIVKQDALAITEVELWKSILRWVRIRTNNPGEQRLMLKRPLRHVRFLVFTYQEIKKYVRHLNILRRNEIRDIMRTVKFKEPFTNTKLCRITTKRTYLKPLADLLCPPT